MDATVDLLGTFARGTGKLGLGFGEDRTRHNIRSFTVTDTFAGLLTQMKDSTCRGLDLQSRNYQYPITGNIGLDEMVGTFVNLSLFSNLENKDAKGPPTMADTITFETKLSGTSTPRVELAPLRRGVSLADAFFTASASRDDIHQVVVGLSLPVAPKKGTKATTFTGQFVTVKGSPAEVSVGEAISQQLLRFEQGNRAILLNGLTLNSTQ